MPRGQGAFPGFAPDARERDMTDDSFLTDRTAPNEADLHVGRRLRALRLKANLSQADVAQRAGISIGALSQIERGVSSLRVSVTSNSVAPSSAISRNVTRGSGTVASIVNSPKAYRSSRRFAATTGASTPTPWPRP